jgi:hypothetical protein
VRLCHFFQAVAGPETTEAPPQVRVWTGLPFVSYLNPVKKKTDAPQGTKGLPFLIAVDVSGLPGALKEIPRAVEGFLPFWPAVSGILLYRDLSGFELVGWEWRFVRNPHATEQLPLSMPGGGGDAVHVWTSAVKFGRR